MTREELLHDLVSLRRPVPEVGRELRAFPWDSEQLVILTRVDAVQLIDRYLAADLSASDCEASADAIEVRDDIGLEPGAEAELRQFIFEVANPILEGPFTHEAARRWRMNFS